MADNVNPSVTVSERPVDGDSVRGAAVKGVVLLCTVVMQLMTAACGQKGPLYLPPRNGTVVTRPATSSTTPNTPPTTDQPSSPPQATPPQTTPPQTSSPQATGPGQADKKDDNTQPPK